VFEALCTSQRIEDDLGGQVGVLIVARDLTERRLAEQQARIDAELRSTIETTRRLSRLQDAAADGPEPVLRELVALLIEHLGWGNVVVNLTTPDGYRVARTSGGPVATALAGVTYRRADFACYLDDRFLRAGAYVIPEEAGVREPGPVYDPAGPGPPIGDADAERPGDLLLVPMRLPDGTWAGIISVDAVRSGRRPSDTELEVLCAVGDHTAIALQRAA
jgi:GAF domain-containing protein